MVFDLRESQRVVRADDTDQLRRVRSTQRINEAREWTVARSIDLTDGRF